MSPPLSLLLLPTLLLLPAVAAATDQAAECPTKCGDVDIPYPFGIGAGCFRSKGFEISCVNNGTTAVLPSATHTIQVTSLSVAPEPAAKVNLPVAYQCYNSTGHVVGAFDGHVDVNTHGAYRISDARNVFVVLGCNTGAYTMNSNSTASGSGRYDHSYYMGCFTYCDGAGAARDGRCASVGCCRVDIAPGLTDNVVAFEDWPHDGMKYSPCDIGFLVDREAYEFRAADLLMDVRRRSMPVRLDWAIRDGDAMSCAAARNRTGYACVSDNSECVDAVNGPGYYCRCKQGYEGNPYLEKNGCTNIDECTRPGEYHCYGVCKDTEGSYDCKCRSGYTTNGGDPKRQQCNPKFPLQAQLALGIPLGFALFAVAVLFALMVRHKRRTNELFRRNGGSVLQQLDNIRIFTREELKKITKNNSHVLGKGGSGHVYKGVLEDGTAVAVKTAIEVDGSGARKGDFTNEVIVQSQMIHKNIIRLVGCCLEVDVPVLVYEFAPNGNLHDLLHGGEAAAGGQRLVFLPLDLRLDIAAEAAEGLKYMHSSTTNTIRHGDVKSANILLDENFMPKISDFGTSTLLTRGEDFAFAALVVGSTGYIDPVFSQTGLLTQKSDVYSFGVVLLELVCRKPTIYHEHCSLVIEFRRARETDGSGRAMFDEEIAVTEEDVVVMEEVGRLAVECLEEEVEDRPDMDEVAERLVMLRRARRHGQCWSYGSPPGQQQYEKNSVGSGALASLATDVGRPSSATVPLIPAKRKARIS